MNENRLDRNQLKVLALRERIATLVVEYEDKDAERRIEITEFGERIKELENEVAMLTDRLNSVENSNTSEEPERVEEEG